MNVRSRVDVTEFYSTGIILIIRTKDVHFGFNPIVNPTPADFFQPETRDPKNIGLKIIKKHYIIIKRPVWFNLSSIYGSDSFY